MKLLKLVCLWAALLALLAGCALEPSGTGSETAGESPETPVSESETAPESGRVEITPLFENGLPFQGDPNCYLAGQELSELLEQILSQTH
ncbi:MAG: hypothetical protein J5849_07130 [Clostridia bacterium]|nr:hypothetical protein [Clostridia bacterium]